MNEYSNNIVSIGCGCTAVRCVLCHTQFNAVSAVECLSDLRVNV